MAIHRTEKVHIWPQMLNEAPYPLTGHFAVTLGKGQAERALSIVSLEGWWFVYLDGRQVAAESTDWREAFGDLNKGRSMFLGRKISSAEHEALRQQRNSDAASGMNLNQPINLNRVKAPF